MALLPPGFRFHPTDEELVAHYVKKKVAGRKVGEGVIGEMDIYKFEPEDLPGLAILQSRDPEWFFFNAQDKKYLHGSRTNRTTKAGYWKATGKDRKISTASCTGMKKTLIYYFGRAPHGVRTDWVMHEFRLDEEFERKMNCSKSFVLCRVRRKGGLGPRNGEQYGAPVLEPSEEDEVDLLTGSNSLDEAYVLPSVFLQGVEEGQVLKETPSAAIQGDVERAETREDFVSFLQNIFPCEELEQQPVQVWLPSVGDLLDNQGGFTMNEPTHAALTNFLDLDSSGKDNLGALLHPSDNESVMLEDLLHLIAGEVEGSDCLMRSDSLAFQEPSRNQASLDMDDLQSVGFLELADLEEPFPEHGSGLFSEFNDFEGSNFVSNSGLEMPSTRLAQENLQSQSLQSFDNTDSIRALHHLEACGMVNEQLALEVPLDSSQGLSVVDSRLLTSDDGGGLSGDLPSGFVLGSCQEGVFANNSPSSLVPSHSQSSGASEQPEAQLTNLSGVNQDVQDAVSQEETRVVGHGEHTSINSHTKNSVTSLEEPDSSTVSFVSSPSSPSSLARFISGVLGKVNVLPASAAELPVELERCKPLMKESSISFAAESKTGHSALTKPGSSSISGSSFHSRVKLNPLLDMDLIAITPEMKLQWPISHAVSDRGFAKPCKSLANGLSIFLFWITTSALILFCMFRGLCRSTRSAVFL